MAESRGFQEKIDQLQACIADTRPKGATAMSREVVLAALKDADADGHGLVKQGALTFTDYAKAIGGVVDGILERNSYGFVEPPLTDEQADALTQQAATLGLATTSLAAMATGPTDTTRIPTGLRKAQK